MLVGMARRRETGRIRDCSAQRPFARFDGGAVAAAVADQFLSKMFLDQRFMHALGQFASANSSKTRENVASEGRRLHSGKPQVRRNARSIVRRSIRPAGVVNPSTALATNALASQANSCGGRPTPHHDAAVNPRCAPIPGCG